MVSRRHFSKHAPTSGAFSGLELQLQGIRAAARLRFPRGQHVSLFLSLRQPALQGCPLRVPGLSGIYELGSHLGSPLLCFLPIQQRASAYYRTAALWQEHTIFPEAGMTAHCQTHGKGFRSCCSLPVQIEQLCKGCGAIT